ncbi:hypothetical protein M1141_02005 [Candidatus Marsarchaeota archaeon]|nr:hypothetical protein [Candidatus Marsarchaeota archaeon]
MEMIIKGDLPDINKINKMPKDYTNYDLKKDNNTMLAQKLSTVFSPSQISFQFNNKNTAVKTNKGYMSCDDSVIVTVKDENGKENSYPISKEEFDATYEKAGDNYILKPNFVLALELNEPFYVRHPWKIQAFYGNEGDWLVKEGNTLRVISKKDFNKHYKVFGNFLKALAAAEKYKEQLRR